MRYVTFGSSGLLVSELCLGTMTFGDDWGWGAPADTARRLFDMFASAGGNFIDTANFYTNGSAERILGDCLASQRDAFVLSTKYSLTVRPGDPNASGNHRKSLVQALEGSLRRLNTDYIDVYWLHCWDFLTPVEEIVRALDDQVRLGKVLYVGISDAPAWRVAQMNTLAELRGWTPFIGLQVEYSLVERTTERELLPMARAFNMAVTAWSPLGAGVLTGKYTSGASAETASDDGGRAKLSQANGRLVPRNLAIADAVVRVARTIGRSPSQVALAWLRQREGTIIPIVGTRKPEQLTDNLGCLDLALSAEHVRVLDEASRIDLGFPHELLRSADLAEIAHGGTFARLHPEVRARVPASANSGQPVAAH